MQTRPRTQRQAKVAVVHDWLTGMRGGEAVLEAILRIYPDADLFTLIHNRGSVSEFIENRRIFTSFIDRLPFKATKYRWYLPLFPTAIELFDFHDYDLIVSSSHCVARGIVPPPDVLTRLLEGFQRDGVDDPQIGLVQARWGHLNASASWLTRAQALLLDAHFVIEQGVRSASGWLDTGGSIASRPTICSRWFWMTSRIAPTPS